jgi:hypothetical protein
LTSPAAGTAPAGWLPVGGNDKYAAQTTPSTTVSMRVGAQLWSWIHARLQEPNTVLGVLIALLVIMLLLQHPLARAIGTESPPSAMSGSTDTAVPAAAPVSPSSVSSLGHAWTSLPDVPQRDPFQPLVGQQGGLQSPVAIGPVPHQHVSSGKSVTGTSSGTVSNPGNASGGSTAAGSGHAATGAGAGGNCFAHHVVQSGDSLWSIADEDLVSHGYKSVAAAVHAVYGANRATIGSDPSYLTPGERLCLPSS